LDANKTLSQTIASLDIPNAKYEEIKLKFETSIEVEMFGILIRGTIDGKNVGVGNLVIRHKDFIVVTMIC
jgi:hypothetical protein